MQQQLINSFQQINDFNETARIAFVNNNYCN